MVSIGDIDGLIYPLSIGDGVKGRWQPYLTGGLGCARYGLDSNYTDRSAIGMNLDAGAGIKLIADNLISCAPSCSSRSTTSSSSRQVLRSRNAGTVKVPVYEFDSLGNYTGRSRASTSSRSADYPRQVGLGVVF